MELWIRSQDKQNLRKITIGLYLKEDLSDYAKGKVWFIVSSGDKLGEYETKERALEILDKIHQRLINLKTLEIAPDSYKVLPRDTSNVYEMPEE